VQEMMLEYSWPGNVRELENAVERAMVIGKGPEITIEDLPLHINTTEKSNSGKVKLSDLEKDHILRMLEETGGNVTKAANLLGIDRVTLYNKMKKYGVKR
jgi:DNA-binding NtrC family response regulator